MESKTETEIFKSILQKTLTHPRCPQKKFIESFLYQDNFIYSDIYQNISQRDDELLSYLWQEIEFSPEELQYLDYQPHLSTIQKKEEVKWLQIKKVNYHFFNAMSHKSAHYISLTLGNNEIWDNVELEEYKAKIVQDGLVLSDGRRYEIRFPKPTFKFNSLQTMYLRQPDLAPPEVIGLWGPYHFSSALEDALYQVSWRVRNMNLDELADTLEKEVELHTPLSRKENGDLQYSQVVKRFNPHHLDKLQHLLPQIKLATEDKEEILNLLQTYLENKKPINL